MAFALVRDRTGSTQLTLKKGVAPPELFTLLGELPRESVVEVEGLVRKSEKANRGIEVAPARIDVLSRAEVPLPLGVVDKVASDLNTRLDHRVIDLRKPAVRGVFELRSLLLASFREAFNRREFLEVETPKILRQGAEGGATLFPIQYFDQTAYLAQSPQLYKQMLMGAGFERVFEIAPAFRAEPSDTVKHITEFGSLDAEMAYVDGTGEVRTAAAELQAMAEEIVRDALSATRAALAMKNHPLADQIPELGSTPFPRIPYAQLEEWLGRPGAEQDLGAEDEKAIWARVQKEYGTPLYFLTDWPTAVKAGTFYARRDDLEPGRTGYFDLYFRGLEIASGGPREHRMDRLLQNIESAGYNPATFPGYLEAFRYGMPPHGGWAIGVDRIVQYLADLPNIREARLFPRDRYRLDP